MINRRRLFTLIGMASVAILAACGESGSTGTSAPYNPADAKFMGGDGIVDGEFFTEAGAAGNGAFGTIAAPEPSRLDSAKKFIDAYKAAFNADPGPYSANAYDAMGIILQAAQQSIIENGGQIPSDPRAFREAVRKHVAATQYDGAIGHTAFDANGDTTNVLLTVKTGKDKAWVYADTVQTSLPQSSGSAAAAASATSTPASSAAASPGGSALSGCTGTVTVASDLPTSGSDASDGQPTQNGAQLAVQTAIQNKLLGGCTIKYIPKDDASVALGKHDPQQGALNLTQLAGNASVIGVVGPFNSNVALVELPIANRANLTVISPSNTNPGLTIAGSRSDVNTDSLRPTKVITYFRVCTTDIGQGKALADYAYNNLHLKTAYVIDDQETYGKGLADQFQQFFKADGGTVAKAVSLPGSTTDFKAQITEARGLNVDLMFFGGTSSNGGGILRKQMIEQGLGTAQ